MDRGDTEEDEEMWVEGGKCHASFRLFVPTHLYLAVNCW